jgi:hypothetical protein
MLLILLQCAAAIRRTDKKCQLLDYGSCRSRDSLGLDIKSSNHVIEYIEAIYYLHAWTGYLSESGHYTSKQLGLLLPYAGHYRVRSVLYPYKHPPMNFQRTGLDQQSCVRNEFISYNLMEVRLRLRPAYIIESDLRVHDGTERPPV